MAPEEAGLRLDRFLALKEPLRSRSFWQKRIETGDVRKNGRPAAKSDAVETGDRIEAVLPPPEPDWVPPEAIPLRIVYEDPHLIVIDKPAGMIVHPGAGHKEGSLVAALLAHCGDLSSVGGRMRPGIVHRLDKDTSGLLVAAKDDAAHLGLARQIRSHQVRRVYRAIAYGVVEPPEATVDLPVGRHPLHRTRMAVRPDGRPAVTHYRVLEHLPGPPRCTFLELRLETGRTHQIRVHLSHQGHPLVDDPTYAPGRPRLGLGRQALHAAELAFQHPVTGEDLHLTAPLPQQMEALLRRLRGTPAKG
ncbi:pseudouridine synthase [Limnochorda pilosa]|uniref:Pseudouridine synthase n=1 Tax=Limnochorda pilosa TaxID=1555112 RepID=A0A0K2SJV0_LIMPI|nr:pseudouridine synthase [Limnochorda pilosa]